MNKLINEKKLKKTNEKNNKNTRNKSSKENENKLENRSTKKYDELEIEVKIIPDKNSNIQQNNANNHRKKTVKNSKELEKQKKKRQKQIKQQSKKNEKIKQNKTKDLEKNGLEKNDIFNFDEETIIGMDNIKKEKNQKQKVKKELSPEEILKRKKAFGIVRFFIIVFVIFLAIILTMFSPLFNITEINVINNSKVTIDEIISLSKIKNGQNMFSVINNQVIKNVKENSYIKSATVTRKLPNKIEISVEERQATYMLEYANAYVYINNQGYILEVTTQKIETPIIIGFETQQEDMQPGRRMCVNDLNKLGMVLKIMEAARNNDLADKITKIDISDKNNYILIFENEGKKAYIGDASDLTTRILYLKMILEKENGKSGDIFVNMNLNTENPVFREQV